MTTYYVDPLSGSDGAAGTSFGAAWATTQKALDTAVAADDVRLCKTATETTAAVVGADTNAGTVGTGRITFTSYNATGTTAEDGYILQASASIADLILYSGSCSYVTWEGVDFDGNGNVTGEVLDHSGVNFGSWVVYLRCKVHNGDAGTHGAEMRGLGVQFYDCEVYECGGIGIGANASTYSRWTDGVVSGCIVRDNGSHGIVTSSGVRYVDGNQIYGNTGAGILLQAGDNLHRVTPVTNNTIFNNGGDGIDATGIGTTANTLGMYNNTMSDNTGKALDNTNLIGFIDYNHSYNNTAGDTLPGSNDASGDPKFTNTGAGTEDFTPLTTSPLIQAGVNSSEIGAVAHADGGGGGGLKIAGSGGLAG